MSAPVYILTIGGSDSSGGAGMQADNRAIHAAGAFPLNVLTAVTLQTPDGVEAVTPLSADFVETQVRALLRAYPVAAIKSGMLANAGIAARVADVLISYPEIPYVLDPVLCATSGRRLLDTGGLVQLRDRLMPRALLTTPNLDELAALAGRTLPDTESMLAAGVSLARHVGSSILLKGGHATGAMSEDVLLRADGTQARFFADRIGTLNSRGTGCALSAGIAARIALGRDLTEAIKGAKQALGASLEAQATSTWCGPGPAFL